MMRTTVFAEEDLIQALRELARTEGKTLSQVIREALQRAVVERQRPGLTLSILAMGRSGQKDVADRHEELLWQHRAPKRKPA